jgi:hypothetical protein
MEKIPDIYAGIGFSYLIGYANAELTEFNGKFSFYEDDEEGLNLDQKVGVKMGMLGQGFKFSFGLSSKVFESGDHSVSAGVSFDNIMGNITWTKDTEIRKYTVSIDSVYIADLLDDTDGIVKDTEEVKKIKSSDTKLPFVFRLGSLYKWKDLTASLDFAKNSDVNAAFNHDPELSLGLEYNIIGHIPVQLGYRVPIGDNNALYSFGLGMRFKNYEWGFGYQNVGAFFMSEETKGLGLTMNLFGKIRF